MNKLFIHIALAGLLLSTPVQANPSTQPVELDYVMAIVNDDVITRTALEDRIRLVTRQLREKKTPLPPVQVLNRQILEQLIIEKIQLQAAEKHGIRVDDETVNNVLANLAKTNGVPVAKFRTILEKDGFNYEDFRESIRNEIIIKRLRKSRVENRVSVSPQEIDNYLANQKNRQASNEAYNLGHILISLPETANAEHIQQAKQKAGEIVRRLRNGADFAQMAVAESAGQQALQGGQLGWRKLAQVPTIFSSVVPQMQVGEISEPIRSASGFHIIKLQDKRSEKQRRIVQQTLARHILMRPNEIRSHGEVKQRLQLLRERILNGEDFATLARSHSDDTGSAVNGGSLGWVSPGVMVARFEEQMDKLQPGQISQPFETRFGWHIVQVMSRRKHDNTNEYLRLQAHNNIAQRKTEEAVDNWLRQIRSESYVEYRFNK